MNLSVYINVNNSCNVLYWQQLCVWINWVTSKINQLFGFQVWSWSGMKIKHHHGWIINRLLLIYDDFFPIRNVNKMQCIILIAKIVYEEMGTLVRFCYVGQHVAPMIKCYYNNDSDEDGNENNISYQIGNMKLLEWFAMFILSVTGGNLGNMISRKSHHINDNYGLPWPTWMPLNVPFG